MMDMAQRMKQNRLLRLARRERTKKVLDSHRDATYGSNSPANSNKLSEEELILFAEEVKQRKENERALVRSKTIKVLLLILFGLFLLFGIASEF